MATCAFLFDLDGTLLDRDGAVEAYVTGLAQRLGMERRLLAPFRERFLALDDHGYGDKRRLFQALVDEFGLPGPVEDLVADFRQNGFKRCQTLPGARDVLAQLRARGCRLAIVTNGSAESQRSKLRATGLDGLVDAVLVSGEEGVRKPEPAIFHRAAERIGVSPAACTFVGDNPESDVAGAHRAGMATVWLQGRLPWPDGLDVTPGRVIDSLPELLGGTNRTQMNADLRGLGSARARRDR